MAVYIQLKDSADGFIGPFESRSSAESHLLHINEMCNGSATSSEEFSCFVSEETHEKMTAEDSDIIVTASPEEDIQYNLNIFAEKSK